MQITVDELTSELLKLTKLKPKEALRFVSAISGSLDHELAHRNDDPELVRISIPDKENVFTLGIVPENALIDSVYASTGLPRQDVRVYLGYLDNSVRPRLRYLKEPVDLEGFGRITQRMGELTYEPLAFQHLRRS